MSVFLLITRPDFADFRAITANLDDKVKLDPFIDEAQQLDIKPQLGYPLYFTLVRELNQSPQTEKYVELLFGKQYTDPDGFPVDFRGIHPALCYFTHARMLSNQNANVTTLGLVKKKTEFSDPLDRKEKGELVQQARSVAISYWSEVVKFLDDMEKIDPTLYPLWTEAKQKNKPADSGFSIGAAGTERNRHWNGRRRHS